MAIDKTPIVLVISTGGQDLKFWTAKAKNGLTVTDQTPFPAERCRDIHKLLWPVASDPGTFRAVIARTLDPQAAGLTHSTGEELVLTKEWKPVLDGQKFLSDSYFFQDGKVLLQPSKTMNLLAAVDPAVAPDIQVVRVLVLYSERERRPKEPIRNGVALGLWLKGELGIGTVGEREFEPGESGIRWVNYLAGLEFYEGALDTVNFPLHTKAAHCIERAVANAADGLCAPVAVYSTRGGFDDIKPIVSAACALHFDGRALCFWDTEQAPRPLQVTPITRARLYNEAVYAIPADTLPARAHALARLHEGDILGAWGVIAHLDTIARDRKWLDWVRDLANFMRGEQPSDRIRTALFDEVGAVPTGIELLMLRAFQVEAALQGAQEQHVRASEAILSTAALVESALELGVFHAAIADGIPIHHDTRELPGRKVAMIQERIHRTITDSGQWTTNKFPSLFLHEDHRINTMGAAAEAWRIWLGLQTRQKPRDLAAAFHRADWYLRESGIKGYRNRLAHLALTKEDADQALSEGGKILGFNGTDEEVGPLWLRYAAPPHQADPSLGGMFLKSPLIVNLFQSFDIPAPAACYCRILGQAMKALHAEIEVIP